MNDLNDIHDKYDEHWAIQQAIYYATLSPCRSQRGVVIWHREHGLISFGFNAPPHPMVCNGSDECKATCSKTAVHAEQAALLNFNPIVYSDCEMLHVKVVDDDAVTSEKPSCWQCSKLILAAGIEYMWLYQKEGLVRYTALDFHDKTLINCGLKEHECN